MQHESLFGATASILVLLVMLISENAFRSARFKASVEKVILIGSLLFINHTGEKDET